MNAKKIIFLKVGQFPPLLYYYIIMDAPKIFEEKEIDNSKFGCYEYHFIPIEIILSPEEALDLLCKRFEMVTKFKLIAINKPLKV